MVFLRESSTLRIAKILRQSLENQSTLKKALTFQQSGGSVEPLKLTFQQSSGSVEPLKSTFRQSSGSLQTGNVFLSGLIFKRLPYENMKCGAMMLTMIIFGGDD